MSGYRIDQYPSAIYNTIQSLITPMDGSATVGETVQFQNSNFQCGATNITQLTPNDAFNPAELMYTMASITPDATALGPNMEFISV